MEVNDDDKQNQKGRVVSDTLEPDMTDETLDLLVEVSQLLAGMDLLDAAEHVVRLATQVTGATRAMLIIFAPSTSHIREPHERPFAVFTHDQDTKPLEDDERYTVASNILQFGLMGWAVRNRQSVRVKDTRDDDRWLQFEGDFYGALSAMVVPLIVQDTMLGALSVSHRDAKRFSHAHLRLLTVIANQAAVSVHHSQTMDMLDAEKRRFEEIIAAAPDILIVLSASGHILTASEPIVLLLDGHTRKSIIGKTVLNLVEIDSVFAPLERVVRGNVSKSDESAPAYGEWSFETRSSKRDRDYLVDIAVWESYADESSGYVVMMKDVTQMRNLGRFKDEMLRAVSHDLRTPVVLIVGYADLLREDLKLVQEQLPDAVSYVTGILEGAERIEAMLDNFLRAEKIRSSPLELLEEVALNELAKDTVHRMRPLAERKGITIEAQFTSEAVPNIVGDSFLLAQAMENLIGNAIKYTPDDGSIIIRTEVRNERFYYIVRDTGVGISQQDLKRVFQSFFRAKPTEDTTQGAGVGLSLVKNFIEQHGGEIDVESMMNKGSTFAFWIPLFEQNRK